MKVAVLGAGARHGSSIPGHVVTPRSVALAQGDAQGASYRAGCITCFVQRQPQHTTRPEP